MINVRPASTRGNPGTSWINSYRTFYFPPYNDRTYTNFGDLETINDDRVQPNNHVPEHLHKNMEIFGYVIEGTCRHTDSFGNVTDIPAGAVQRMSCGSGIRHTEGNASDQPNRYLQLWIRPNEIDYEPSYNWHQFTRENKLDNFCDITKYLPIKQDAKLRSGIFTKTHNHLINNQRRYYLYVVSGSGTILGSDYVEGTGFSLIDETEIKIEPATESEIILFDLR